MVAKWVRSDGKVMVFTNISKVCSTQGRIFAIKKGEENTSNALDLTDIDFTVTED